MAPRKRRPAATQPEHVFPEINVAKPDLTIYLDIGGVCADFWGRAISLFPEIGVPEVLPGGRLPYYVGEYLGVKEEEVDERINEAGAGFWSAMEPQPWFKTLIFNLRQTGYPFYFLSSSGRYEQSVQGKMRWLQKKERFGTTFCNFVFTPHKHLLAHDRAVLIDDRETNTLAFRNAGGRSILCPQQWNLYHNRVDDAVNVVLDELDTIIREIKDKKAAP